ncbi:MAG TPA: Kdo hydroxylase family protein [Gammaproteobacteria bacterium]|nr:Kdo hydroxylase family protein [Gammaproteobacteria bacterium]
MEKYLIFQTSFEFSAAEQALLTPKVLGAGFKNISFNPKNRSSIPPFFGYRKLLSLLKITKSYRSLYDHMMLILHDEMKKSDEYQNKVQKTDC